VGHDRQCAFRSTQKSSPTPTGCWSVPKAGARPCAIPSQLPARQLGARRSRWRRCERPVGMANRRHDGTEPSGRPRNVGLDAATEPRTVAALGIAGVQLVGGQATGAVDLAPELGKCLDSASAVSRRSPCLARTRDIAQSVRAAPLLSGESDVAWFARSTARTARRYAVSLTPTSA
jgi:hypothetical protein